VESRIPASERTSQKLKELLTQGVAEGDARSELIKLAVRKIVEEALEAEVAEALGRGYYENGATPGAGYRNGYRPSRLRTAEGAIEYGVPQVADRAETFVSRVRAGLAGRTAELEQLAVEMYARGLSTRDIEAAFRDASGASVLSRTAVSHVTERLWQEYEAFAGRDLSEFAIAYFFVDGVAERLHPGLPREAVLCAWGITEDLKRRGLADPLLAVTDGAPGLIRAVETCFPRALRQRCLVHRMRNLRSKAPESQWPEIALRARGCYEAASPALAAMLRDDFVTAYERELPAVVQCFRDDFDACIAHLRFPLRHRRVVRTTDENVKWRVAASGNRLGVGTGDPDRSVGHEASSTAQVALWRIRRAPLWGTRAPRPRGGRVVRSVPFWSAWPSWAVEAASVRRASDRRAPLALRAPALVVAAPSGCTRA
jgi:transposase-like protein